MPNFYLIELDSNYEYDKPSNQVLLLKNSLIICRYLR